MSTVQAIPAAYAHVTPYLYIKDAAKALEFYQAAFNAEILASMPMPDGKIAHAEIKIFNSIIMLGDECTEMQALSPQTIGGSSVNLVFYVENVDQAFERAVAAGATIIKPLADQFYGDRMGGLQDPFGHLWSLASHVEDVSPEEINLRYEQWQQEHIAKK